MTILSVKVVKTRKDHKCFGCNLGYSKGNTLTRIVIANDGTAYSTYWCEVCNVYWDKYMGDSEGIFQGDLMHEEHYKIFKQKYNDKKRNAIPQTNGGM